MGITKLSYEALNRYFTRLSLSGYVKYPDVYSLIVLLYMQELMKEYTLDTDELNIVTKALECLQGNNCLISYYSCKGTCV